MNKHEPQAAPPEINEVFNKQNLVYNSDDMEVYSVSGDIDIDQLRSLNGGSLEFNQRSDWRIARQLENMKQDLAAQTLARLQALEEAIVSRLQAAEDKLGQQEENISRLQTMVERREPQDIDIFLRDVEARLQQLEDFCGYLLVVVQSQNPAPDFDFRPGKMGGG